MSKLTGLLAGMLAGMLAVAGCASDGTFGVEPTCENMCTNLRAAPLSGCGDSDAETQSECVSECEDQLVDGDSDEAGVACGVEAATCDQWEACGNLI